jgi:hypothetical protein
MVNETLMRPLSLSPPCGERVGVRGPFHESELAEAPPHPDLLHSPSKTGVNALMASGEKGHMRLNRRTP